MKKFACALAAVTAMAPISGIAEESAKAPRAMCAPAAHVQAMKGGVMLSRGGSFAELKAGAPLAAGDRILVRDGSANISVGEDSMKLASGSMMTISGKDGLVCAAQTLSNPGVVGQGAGPGGIDPAVVVGVGGLALLGTGIGIAVSQNGGGNKTGNATIFPSAFLPLPPLSGK